MTAGLVDYGVRLSWCSVCLEISQAPARDEWVRDAVHNSACNLLDSLSKRVRLDRTKTHISFNTDYGQLTLCGFSPEQADEYSVEYRYMKWKDSALPTAEELGVFD